MKRTILLLLPIAALAVDSPEGGTKINREEATGLLWQESLAAESNGKASVAMEKLMSYSKNGGDSYMVNLRAAWLNFSDKKYEDAARYYSAAARLKPAALSPLLGLLNTAQAKGDGAAAIAAAEAVLKIEPSSYRALMAVAWGAFQAKDYRKSGRAYQRVLELYPEDADAMSGVAWSAFHLGKKREAQIGFRRLMSLNPEYEHVREGLDLTSK